MSKLTASDNAGPVFRVDKFLVPPESLDAFVGQMRHVHTLLDDLPGCRQRRVLTQTAGAGKFNVVTMIEWASAADLARALSVMPARFAKEGFDPKDFVKRLGITADLGIYHPA
ncbi:MAG: antibiotic biosynthesis monooxygenase [Massilia sp.]